LYKIICICWTRYPHSIPKLDALLSGSLQYVFKNLSFFFSAENVFTHFRTAKVVLFLILQTFFCLFLKVFFNPQNRLACSQNVLNYLLLNFPLFNGRQK